MYVGGGELPVRSSGGGGDMVVAVGAQERTRLV